MSTAITWGNFNDLVGQKGFYHDEDRQLIALAPFWLGETVKEAFLSEFGDDSVDENFRDWFMTASLFPRTTKSLGRRLIRYAVTNDRVLDRAILGSVYPKPKRLWYIGKLSDVKPIHLEDFLQILRIQELRQSLEKLSENLAFVAQDRFGVTARIQINTRDLVVSAHNINPNNHRRDHSLQIPSRSIILSPGPNIP